jgi:hypothetical protein
MSCCDCGYDRNGVSESTLQDFKKRLLTPLCREIARTELSDVDLPDMMSTFTECLGTSEIYGAARTICEPWGDVPKLYPRPALAGKQVNLNLQVYYLRKEITHQDRMDFADKLKKYVEELSSTYGRYGISFMLTDTNKELHTPKRQES